MSEYKVVYSYSFDESFQKIIRSWKRLSFSEITIKKFIKVIDSSIKTLKDWPEMYEDVSDRYGFSVSTHRFFIINNYSCFYRINQQEKLIEIGSIYNCKQQYPKF